MSKEMRAIILSIMATVVSLVINLLVVVYGFGSLSSDVRDIQRRVNNIEGKLSELLIEFKTHKQVTDWRLEKLEAGKK